MTSSDQRRHPRLNHRARIRVILPVLSSEFVVNMRDFSQSGLFLLCPDSGAVSVGAIVEVQTTEFDDAPVQKAKVARLEPGVGFAVEFLTE